MAYNYISISPEQLKFRRIKLLRVGLLLLLIGSCLSLLPSIGVSMYQISAYLGAPWDVIYIYRMLNNEVFGFTSGLLNLAGHIFLVISLVKLPENSSPELTRKCKITYALLIAGLSFGIFSVFLLYMLIPLMYSLDIENILQFGPLIQISIYSAAYVLLGFTIKQLKSENRLGSNPPLTPFIFIASVVLQIFSYLGLFSTITDLIIASVVSILALAIKIVLFSEALVHTNKVKNVIIETIPIPKFSSQTYTPAPISSNLTPSNKGYKFCFKCGTPIVPNARFCGECGQLLE